MAEVLRSSSVEALTGVCGLKIESAGALWMEIESSETALQSACGAALFSARLLVRWRVTLHVTALTMSCLSPHSTSIGEPLRLCETLKKQLERWDYSLLNSLPRTRAATVMAYMPLHILSVAANTISQTSFRSDPQAIGALENALTTLFHNLHKLACLLPLLPALALREQLDKSIAKFRHGVSAAIADKVAQKIAKSLQENYSGTSGNY
eukprot:CAMPEP_0179451172 /NCGR_PEP_ID=MMETSP0799-20121207/35252_1 /TAXON_ID=46947 /ORGANISM="Geminigera cryophila, Strain CCMP2564" /LENGTH=208 /DNA_ID=CAMNT_0021246217 /DNA_START=207 /DNA_END=833 /DNA_ORIENTATION=+